jgi:hypothetical protein
VRWEIGLDKWGFIVSRCTKPYFLHFLVAREAAGQGSLREWWGEGRKRMALHGSLQRYKSADVHEVRVGQRAEGAQIGQMRARDRDYEHSP